MSDGPLDTPGADDDGPVVTTRVAPRERERADAETRTRKQPPYHVILLNDEEHTFDYVIEMLGKLFGHPAPVGEAMAWRVHTAGRSIVYTTHKEKAELKCEQVLAYGPDPRMSDSKGSMGCYIEPAESE